MEKSITVLAAELLVKNQGAWWGSTIQVKDENGNLFTFVFTKPGYSEFTTYKFECHSDLFERAIGFGITTVYEEITMEYFHNPNYAQTEMKYDKEMVSKHEETLRRAIELALPMESVKPTT